METETQIELGMKELMMALDGISLTTLSEKYNIQVVTLENPVENSQSVKFVFSRTHKMGIIFGDTYMMKPEYFKGGKHNNAIIDQETKMIMQTFKLREVKKLNADAVTAAGLDELKKLVDDSAKINDITQMDELNDNAKSLMQALASDEARELYDKIHKNYLKLLEEGTNNESSQMLKLEDLSDDLDSAENVEDKKRLITEMESILAKLPANELTKSYGNQVRAEKLALQKPVTDTGKEQEEKNKKNNSQREKDQQQYEALIKKADKFFDQANYEEAEKLYKMANKLRPTLNHATEKMEIIKRLRRKTK